MNFTLSPGALLVLAVAAVGVLHTLVPDHWVPITLLSRQRGWTRAQTARAAATAGAGHAVSTLILAAIVWIAGALAAEKFGHLVSIASSLALVGFGLWIAVGSWRELHDEDSHGHAHMGHGHLHRHADGTQHRHWHEHHDEDWHADDAGDSSAIQTHEHGHAASGRTALLLIVGSSPMVEGIPAFFAASRYGVTLLAIMAVVFAASTIVTYVVLCVASAGGMERVNLGPLERYGEVLSGSFIALLGLVFLFLPAL